jgi:DNA modification methylase
MDYTNYDGNLIINGDATVHNDVRDLIKELIGIERVELIVTDPPYGDIVDEDWDKDVTAQDYIKWAALCESLLVDGGSAFMWGGIGTHMNRVWFEFLSKVEKETHLRIRNVITWSKKRAYGKSNDYLFTREELAWLVYGEKPRVFNIPLLEEKRGYPGYNKKYPAKSEFKRRTNVWTDVTEIMRGKVHPTEKPIRLSEILIETHSMPGEYVLDLFAGSGSTALAAKKLGRKYIMVEKEPEYYQLMVERLK